MCRLLSEKQCEWLCACVCVRACVRVRVCAGVRERENTCRNNLNILLHMLNGYRLISDRSKNPYLMIYTIEIAKLYY